MVQVVGTNSTFDGTIVNYTDYDAYGNAITQSGGSVNPGAMSNGEVTTDISTDFAFGAGYWDSSNLTYLVHRYLDNESGQFISVDPLVDQTREAYVYAGDGPVMAIDAMGTSTDMTKVSQWASQHAHDPKSSNGSNPDCTNFVSTALHIGGFRETESGWGLVAQYLHRNNPDAWFRHQIPSKAWANAHSFFSFLQLKNAKVVKSQWGLGVKGSLDTLIPPASAKPGDIIFASWNSGSSGQISHAGVIVDCQSASQSCTNGLAIAQHSSNTIDSFMDWRNCSETNPGGETYAWILRPKEW